MFGDKKRIKGGGESQMPLDNGEKWHPPVATRDAPPSNNRSSKAGKYLYDAANIMSCTTPHAAEFIYRPLISVFGVLNHVRGFPRLDFAAARKKTSGKNFILTVNKNINEQDEQWYIVEKRFASTPSVWTFHYESKQYCDAIRQENVFFSSAMVGVEAKSNSQQQKYTRRGSKWWCDVVIHSLCTKSEFARFDALNGAQHKEAQSWCAVCKLTFRWCNKMGFENVVNSKRCCKSSLLLLDAFGASEASPSEVTKEHSTSTWLCDFFAVKFIQLSAALFRLCRMLFTNMEMLSSSTNSTWVYGRQSTSLDTRSNNFLLLHVRKRHETILRRGKDYATIARNFD